MWLTVSFKGKAAHAAKPWEGENPLLAATKFVHSFREFKKEVWQTTIVPTTIRSDNSQNQIPSEVKVGIDCRYVPTDDPEQIIKRIRQLAVGVDIQVCAPALSHKDHEYTEKLRLLSGNGLGRMHFATDARFFGEKGIACMIFGPQGEGMHSDNEWVSISSLDKYFGILKELVS